jgi:4-carboxymuconolactone decarboxylase
MTNLLVLGALLLVCTGVLVGGQPRDLGLRGDRFRPLTWSELTPAQQTMVNDLLAGRRASLGGPFNAFLRSPDMGNLAQKLGEHVRFRSSLPSRLNEMAILMTARWWLSQYEWYAHESLALKAGLSAGLIDALRQGRRPARMQADEAIVFAFCSDLRERRRVSDATFQEAVKLFGEQGVMDLIATMGYYDLVSMTLNVDRYPLPAGAAAPFPEPVSTPPARP